MAMHGTISCIVRTGPCRRDARNSNNNRCAIRVDIHGHVRQGNWVRKIHPRDSAVIGYTSNERRGGELESEKRYRHADSRLRRDFSNANWPTLIFTVGGFRIGGLWWEIVLLRGGCAMNNVNFQICNCFEASVIDWFVSLFSRVEVLDGDTENLILTNSFMLK